MLSVGTLARSDFDAWDAFVRASPDGSVYSTPEYLQVLSSVTGGRYSVVAVRKGDDIVGGVGLYEQQLRGQPYVAPRLLLYYNGVVARRTGSRYESSRASDWIGITDALASHFDQSGHGRVTLRGTGSFVDARAFVARGWRATPSYSYVVPITDETDMWGRVDQNLRRLVRRAESAGVTFTVDDDFESFYELHRDTMHRKGKPTYLPRERFRTFVRALVDAGLGTLMHARERDGRSVAVVLVLLGGFPVAHTVCAAGDEERLQLGVNPFLRWRSLLWLRERGYAGNDLTDAALNPVTRFKSQLGGELSMSLSLDRPRRTGYRLAAALDAAYWRARGTAGSVARRILGRT